MSRPGGEARSILVEPAIANFYARAFSRSPIRPCGAAQSAHRIADYRRLRRRSPGSAISEMEWHGDGDRDAKQGQPASRCTHRDRGAALHPMRTPAWGAHRDAPLHAQFDGNFCRPLRSARFHSALCSSFAPHRDERKRITIPAHYAAWAPVDPFLSTAGRPCRACAREALRALQCGCKGARAASRMASPTRGARR